MKAGRPTSLLPGKIDYKQLRKVNPEAARLVLSCGNTFTNILSAFSFEPMS